jgi:glutamyl-tRNA synthetase
MLAFLGWNPGTQQELFSIEELSEAFTLDRVSKAGAKFDPDKTKWFQQQYLRAASNIDLAQMIQEKGASSINDINRLSEIAALMKERATFVEDIVTEGSYLFEGPKTFDDGLTQKKWNEQARTLLSEWKVVLADIDVFNKENIELEFKRFLSERNLNIGVFLPIFRLAITGTGMGPSMFDISDFLGKQECITRINYALEQLP